MLDDLINVINTLKGRIRDHRGDLEENETRTRMALFGCATTAAPAAKLIFLTLSGKGVFAAWTDPAFKSRGSRLRLRRLGRGRPDRTLRGRPLPCNLPAKSVEEAMPGAPVVAP